MCCQGWRCSTVSGATSRPAKRGQPVVAADDPAAARLCVSYAAAGAYVLSLCQHPRESIAWSEAAAAAAREIGDRRGEGNALGSLGNAYAALGDPRRAIESLREALDIFEAIESPSVAQVWSQFRRSRPARGQQQRAARREAGSAGGDCAALPGGCQAD